MPIVYVDASFYRETKYGWAGFVLTIDDRMVGQGCAVFQCRSSGEAEFQAVIRGYEWAAECVGKDYLAVFSDNDEAISKARASHPEILIDWNKDGGGGSFHRMAHNLARRLKRAYENSYAKIIEGDPVRRKWRYRRG